jgi:hypothetical protein
LEVAAGVGCCLRSFGGGERGFLKFLVVVLVVVLSFDGGVRVLLGV